MSRRLTEGEHWKKCDRCGRYFIVQKWKVSLQRKLCATCHHSLYPFPKK